MSTVISSVSTGNTQAMNFEQLPPNTAAIAFNNRQVIEAASPLALEWFGNLLEPNTQFDDAFLTTQSIRLTNRHFRTISLQDILSNAFTDRYMGIAFSHQTRWVQWSLHRNKQTILFLTDVSDLMKDVHALQNRAEEADTRDFSTRLYNRRYAMERLEQMHHHAKRYHSTFTIAMIDIDHFKRINDTFGHAYGDEVLERLASVIRKSFRETDLCARFGGEEFLVLMPETETHDAMYSLDRLRQQVSELKWSKMQRPVTISSGVIAWQQNKSIEQLIFLADQRLMTAKKAGRNQVCGDLI